MQLSSFKDFFIGLYKFYRYGLSRFFVEYAPDVSSFFVGITCCLIAVLIGCAFAFESGLMGFGSGVLIGVMATMGYSHIEKDEQNKNEHL